MSLVVANEPSSLAEVDTRMRSIEQMAEQSESIPEILDWANRAAAFKTYLTRTSKDGRARVDAASRRLELRIGVLLGPSQNGGDRKTDQFTREVTDLAPNQINAFRQMAEHPDIVEAVIAGADDSKPPSRSWVLRKIKAQTSGEHARMSELAAEGLTTAEIADRVGKTYRAVNQYLTKHHIEPGGQTRSNMDDRLKSYKKLSAEGHTLDQIAEKLGVRRNSLAEWVRQNALPRPPAEGSVARTRRLDNDRIVNETVLGLEGTVVALKLAGNLADAGLNPDLIEGWVTSMNASMTALTRFHKQLKEMTQ